MQQCDQRSRDFDRHLGAAWGEGAWYAEQNPFLSLEDVCQLHVLVWSPFLQLDLRQRASLLRDKACFRSLDVFTASQNPNSSVVLQHERHAT